MTYSGGLLTGTVAQGVATGVNDSGQFVGYVSTAAGNKHAFLESGANLTDLGTLGGTDSFAQAINAGGQVAGSSRLTHTKNSDQPSSVHNVVIASPPR